MLASLCVQLLVFASPFFICDIDVALSECLDIIQVLLIILVLLVILTTWRCSTNGSHEKTFWNFFLFSNCVIFLWL